MTEHIPLRTSRMGTGHLGRAAATACACAILGASLVLGGCGGTAPKPAMDPKALQGVEWALTGSSMSSADLGAFGITLNFDAEQASGYSGVNQYGGPYKAGADGTLEIGPLFSTQMAGPEPAMRAEQAYLKLIASCDGYRIEGGRLTLLTGAKATLIYEKAKAVELPGSSWNVTAYNNGKDAVTTLAPGTAISLAFGSDGFVSGNGGVNRYNGEYTATGPAVTIGPLQTTEMAGEPELMEQEAAYVKALEASTKWSVVQGRLELRAADGSMLVVADPTD